MTHAKSNPTNLDDDDDDYYYCDDDDDEEENDGGNKKNDGNKNENMKVGIKENGGQLENKKCSTHCLLLFERSFLTKRCRNCSQIRSFELRHVLSRFGRGDTRVRRSFIVLINTFYKIAKFIYTRRKFKL